MLRALLIRRHPDFTSTAKHSKGRINYSQLSVVAGYYPPYSLSFFAPLLCHVCVAGSSLVHSHRMSRSRTATHTHTHTLWTSGPALWEFFACTMKSFPHPLPRPFRVRTASLISGQRARLSNPKAPHSICRCCFPASRFSVGLAAFIYFSSYPGPWHPAPFRPPSVPFTQSI